MKIKEIKNKELRELAESRIDVNYCDYEEFLKNNGLDFAFDWQETKEGFKFWEGVYDGIITEIPVNKRISKPTLSKEEVNELIKSELETFTSELIQKNEDYNNSLHQKNIFGQDPIEGLKARMSDKFNRIISKGFDDKTEDSMKDLFCYYIHYKVMTK